MKDTCPGRERCELASGAYAFSACSAEGLIPEVCNHKDDNCNGLVDEGFVDGNGRYIRDTDCGDCGNNCRVQWNPALYHGAVGYCDASGATPTCKIDVCQDLVTDRGTYEQIDANRNPNDGCECVRVKGNTTVD
jgi:hypothetical protein